jgi:hypothetical protein
LADDFYLPFHRWNNTETTAALDAMLPDILMEAALDAQAEARAASSPFLRSHVGPSTVSPIAGGLRADIGVWLDHDIRGIYAGVGNRGHFARVAGWLGAAGGKVAKQIKRQQAYLVRAVLRTAGRPMRRSG